MNEIKNIENIINNLVIIQENIIKEYDDMDTDNYTTKLTCIQKLVNDEQDDLFLIKGYLNKLFNIEYSLLGFRNFRIIDNGYDGYLIKAPLFFTQQKTIEYNLLKKTLKKLHRKYFLYDGCVGYTYDNDLEEHCWVIPNRAREIKRQLNIK